MRARTLRRAGGCILSVFTDAGQTGAYGTGRGTRTLHHRHLTRRVQHLQLTCRAEWSHTATKGHFVPPYSTVSLSHYPVPSAVETSDVRRAESGRRGLRGGGGGREQWGGGLGRGGVRALKGGMVHGSLSTSGERPSEWGSVRCGGCVGGA